MKRFTKNPKKASAIKNLDPVALAQNPTTAEAAVPTRGPARPDKAS